jgi:lipopolysaccharide/colanic/teichoic acid biosynthesis glycosyltransferase
MAGGYCRTGRHAHRAKRALDVAGALTGLVLLSPLMLAIAVAVLLTMGAPVLYRQRRPGRRGKPFTLLKFRTMDSRRDRNGAELDDGERITLIGRLLRKTSLDELPELLNVLVGDMSLVGPRPLLLEYLPLYSDEQARRHELRPGITGWAQINGRNAIGWHEKFAYDVWYIDHWSLALDLKILWRSLFKVWHAEGISQAGHATTEKFRGNSP